MKTIISSSHIESSENLANYIIDYVNKKPKSLLCFAGGESPLETYRKLVEANKLGKVNFSEIEFVSLDEWGGLDYNTNGSCIQTLYDDLFIPLGLNIEKQVHFFNGKAKDLEQEILRINNIIKEHDKIDISLLGVGMNGHLGFNEPGSDLDLEVGIIPLDPVTLEVGKKYFDVDLDLKVGITVGLKHLLNSNQIILIANGDKKAKIVYKTINDEISNEMPSSLVRKSKTQDFILI